MYKFKVKLWKNIPKEICEIPLLKYKQLKDDYYTVYFFDDIEEMYKFYDKKFGKLCPCEHNYNGLCKYDSKIYLDENNKFLGFGKNCGVILYYLDELGASVLCHEIAHAITFYFQYRINHQDTLKIFDIKDMTYNELFAYMSGNLARQINNKYYEVIEKQKKQE